MTEGTSEQGGGIGAMSPRTVAWLAWAACALSLALTALCFLLIFLMWSLNTPAYFFWLNLTVLAGGYSVIGAIIASRRPRHPIGWICCAIGLIAAVDHFAGEYAVYALHERPEALPGGIAMLWLQSWFWMLFVGLVVFLLLLFPTGRLPSSRWRPFVWLSIAVILVGVIYSSVISPDVRIDAPPNPIQLLVLALGVVAAASLVVGRRGARGVEREQIKWLLYAGPIWFIGGALQIAVFYFMLVEGPWGMWVALLLVAVGGLGVPIAIGVAILRYRLYDIDLIINRTLVYGALTVVLAGIFQTIDAALHYLLVTLAHAHTLPGAIIAALIVGALFHPIRHRIQRFVDGYLPSEEKGKPGYSEEASTS